MKKYIILLLVLVPLTAFSQNNKLSIKNRKAIELYNAALSQYNRYNFVDAEKYLIECIEREPKFVEAHLVLSQIYEDTDNPEKAIELAEKALSINSELYPQAHYSIGQLYYRNGLYEKSLQRLEYFILNYATINPRLTEKSRLTIKACKFAIEAIANPVPFEPINLGDGINSQFDEYWPSLSADEQTLVYTSRCPKEFGIGNAQSQWQEDFFISKKDNNTWQKGIQLGEPINTNFNEGAQTLTPDGKKMYFTVCRRQCNIYVSQMNSAGSWTAPIKLSDAVNSVAYNEKQPSISPDGRTLYFVSNRPEGKGGYDIWYSTRSENGVWAPAQNIGDSINTPSDEQSPFIHFDNQTLYFSSEGHMGMGGQDIFMAQRDTSGKWSKPKNLGYPINTHKNEEGLIVNAKGITAYYSSDIVKENGRDIFLFDLPSTVQPVATSYLTGTIIDKNTNAPISASVSLIDLETKNELMNSTTGKSGNFLVCLPTNRKYGLFVSSTGYLFHSEHFDFNGIYPIDKPYLVDIKLNPIKKDEVIIMRNIFYATDSYELQPESTVELNKIVTILQQNPTINIEIGGHTDNQGSNEYNQKLSEQRAKSVTNYILSHGIDSKRVSWVGYGESCPIESNGTSEGRTLNRRTEMKVL